MKPYFRNKKAIAVTTLILLLLIGASSGSYYFGFKTGLEEPRKVIIENITDTNVPAGINTDFSIFWEVRDKLKKNYISDQKLDDQTLVYGAVKGLVNSLGDPNTVFFTPEESERFNEDISGSFGGIGAEIAIKNSQLIVVAPLKNTPAERAGLKPDDRILKINDKSTEGLTVDEAVRLIRGEVNTKVILTILREGWAKEREVPITRETIEVPTAEWQMKDDKIIYLRLSSFNANTPFVFYRAMSEGLLSGGRGLVLDLRNNPGGYLEVAVDLAGWFIDRGNIVVTEKFTSGEKRDFRAYGNEALTDFPVVVIMNGGSASASEILAGALRVHRGIKIIGEKSFGKGTVQELQDLSDGSTLKVTISYWLLPDGQLIEKNGLEPDYKVAIEEDTKTGQDPQLDKAIEVLKEEMKKK